MNPTMTDEFVTQPPKPNPRPEHEHERLIEEYGLQDLAAEVRKATCRATIYNELRTDKERSEFLKEELTPTEEGRAQKAEKQRLGKRRETETRQKAAYEARKQKRAEFENKLKAQLEAANKVVWDNLPEDPHLKPQARPDAAPTLPRTLLTISSVVVGCAIYSICRKCTSGIAQ